MKQEIAEIEIFSVNLYHGRACVRLEAIENKPSVEEKPIVSFCFCFVLCSVLYLYCALFVVYYNSKLFTFLYVGLFPISHSH